MNGNTQGTLGCDPPFVLHPFQNKKREVIAAYMYVSKYWSPILILNWALTGRL